MWSEYNPISGKLKIWPCKCILECSRGGSRWVAQMDCKGTGGGVLYKYISNSTYFKNDIVQVRFFLSQYFISLAPLCNIVRKKYHIWKYFGGGAPPLNPPLCSSFSSHQYAKICIWCIDKNVCCCAHTHTCACTHSLDLYWMRFVVRHLFPKQSRAFTNMD